MAEVKREWEKKDGDKMLRSERYFGNIYRSFTLPYDLDEAKSVAKFDSGVLELKLVKKAGVAGKKLPIVSHVEVSVIEEGLPLPGRP